MTLSSPINRLFFSFLIAIAVLPLQAAGAQDRGVVDEIVAVVGDQIVLRSEVDGYVASVMQEHRQAYTDELWSDALNSLIDQRVLAVVASRDTTITVTEVQLDQALDQRVRQLTQQVGGQAKLEELYGKSVIQVKADLRGQFKDQMLAEQLQRRKMDEIRVTPSEVRDWFAQFPTDSLPTLPEMVRVSHIVRYPTMTDAARNDARDMLTSIRDSILAGGSFEEMARQFSDDPGSAATGGRIEDTQLGDLVPEFAAVATRITPGEVSQVFETPFGYHIVRVNERLGEMVDFNHILIRIDDSKIDPGSAIAFLESIRDSIVTHGAPFELMAKRYSQEKQSSGLGGRVTDPRSGERDLFAQSLGPSWQASIDTLEFGEIGHATEVELLDGRRAVHLVRLDRRIPEHRWDISTDYARIEQYALQEKRGRVMESWLNRLREQVYVDLRGKAQELAVARNE